MYAAVTYYLLNKSEYEEYVRHGNELAQRWQEEYWASLTPEQREKQTAMRDRLRALKAQFTDQRGRLDHDALQRYVAAEKDPIAGASS